MSGIALPAFAKVNLRLDVVGRRADGFHELRTIFQTISLHDTLRLEWNRGGAIELEIAGNVALASESPRSNLVYRALETLRGELGIRRGLRARLEKRIPAGRGLGGRGTHGPVAPFATPHASRAPDRNRVAARLRCSFLSVRRPRGRLGPRRANFAVAGFARAQRAGGISARSRSRHARRLFLARAASRSAPRYIDKPSRGL